MANCAYCGAYIKEGGNTQMFKSLGSSMGLDIVGDAIGGVAKLAGHKQYCSKRCKEAAEGGGGGSSSGGGGGTSAAQAEALRLEEEAKEAENDRKNLETIRSISFDGESRDVINQLSNLLVICPTFGKCFGNSGKANLVSAVNEKAEVGIRTLRSLGDNTNADYYEKKFKSTKIRKFASLIGVGIGVAGIALIFLLMFIMVSSL